MFKALFTQTAAIAVLMLGLMAPSQASCVGGACVYGDGGLVAVDSGNGALLGPVLNALLPASAVDVGIIDHRALAHADIDLQLFLDLLQVELDLANPEQLVDAEIDLLTLVQVGADVLQAEGDLVGADLFRQSLLALPEIEGVTIPVADLLNIDFADGNFVGIDINVLNLLTWGIELFNYENGLTTPRPLVLDTPTLLAPFGLSGIAEQAEIFLQVVEPPNFGCSEVGTVFRSPAMRVKINLDLLDISPSNVPLLGALTTLLGPLAEVDANIRVGDLELYAEIGSTTATVNRVSVAPEYAELAVEPGVAHAWLGHIDDEVFFDEQRAIDTDQDLEYSEVGAVELELGLVGTELVSFSNSINIRSHSTDRNSAELLQYFGPFPETQRSSGGTASISRLISNLINNMDIRVDIDDDGGEGGVILDPILDALNVSLDILLEAVDEVLELTLDTVILPVLEVVLENAVDLILELLGIYIAEAQYTVAAVYQTCDLSGRVYHDQNHNRRRDPNEASTGLSLWVKRRDAGGNVEVTAVDPTSGHYRFTNVLDGPQTIIVDDNNDPNDFTATVPAGWVGTAPEDLEYQINSVAGPSGYDFGLFNGSHIRGNVFADNGVDASGNFKGNANNGRREGHERGVADSRLELRNNNGDVIDSTRTDVSGNYDLWLPASQAGPVVLKQFNRFPMISTGAELGNSGGEYSRDTDELRFNAEAGTRYQGLNFADVAGGVLRPQHQGYAAPGGSVIYGHEFSVGTEGSVRFSVENPHPQWRSKLYTDTNCNGRLDSGDKPLQAAVKMKPFSRHCVLMQVQAPADANEGDSATLTLQADFEFTGATPELSKKYSVADVTIVSTATAGISLEKYTNKQQAKPGDTMVFTLRYVNTSEQTIDDLLIEDVQPLWTTIQDQQCGERPSGIEACQPLQNGEHLSWQLDGRLAPGDSGSVSFTVQLDQ